MPLPTTFLAPTNDLGTTLLSLDVRWLKADVRCTVRRMSFLPEMINEKRDGLAVIPLLLCVWFS